MATTYIFMDGKLMYQDKIASANGVEYVLLKDYDILKNENNQLKHDLNEIYNQLIETEKQAQEKISELESDLEEWKAEARALKKNRDEMLANFRKGIEPYVDLQEMHERIVELESELEVKDNLLKIKNGLCSSFDCLPCEPISVANMLINAKKECELGAKYLVDKYSIHDLEQIAEHLLVHCRHSREDDE